VETLEKVTADRQQIAFTDSTLTDAFKDWLLKRFPEVSRFERDGGAGLLEPKVMVPPNLLPTVDAVVVLSGAPHMIRAWVKSYKMSSNTLPVEVFENSLEPIDDETREGIKSIGRVIDATDIYREVSNQTPRRCRQHGWVVKQYILASVQHEWAIWCDHDLEIRGDLTPMLDYMVHCKGAWFGSPRYAPMTRRYSGGRVAQHGIMILKPRSAQMRKWVEYCDAHPEESNDEIQFYRAFSPYPEQEVVDLYRPEWYDTFDVGFGYDGQGLKAVSELMLSNAATVHWPAPSNKSYMLRSVAEREAARVGAGTPVVSKAPRIHVPMEHLHKMRRQSVHSKVGRTNSEIWTTTRQAILDHPTDDGGMWDALKTSLRVHEAEIELKGSKLGNCWVKQQWNRVNNAYIVVLKKEKEANEKKPVIDIV